METRLADWISDTPQGKEAEAILRACVHCGFCNATCPTYQLLGDELDGPRGRIYLIKQLLEGQTASARTRLHLDRCLTCRSCETTCPSGVKYHRLLDIGRQVMTERFPRPIGQRVVRRLIAEGMTRPQLFAQAVRLGQVLRPLLPSDLGDKLPPSHEPSSHASHLSHPSLPSHASQILASPSSSANETAPLHRRVLLLAGCVQPGLAPSINIAARRIMTSLGIDAIEAPKAGCCGALRFHLDQQAESLDDMRQLIDLWWPFISNGKIEALIVTASGCGAHIKDYGTLLGKDPDYAEKARQISEMTHEVGEFLLDQSAALAASLTPLVAPISVAVHTPCSLQHALKRRGDIEHLLLAAGYTLTPVADPHLCCGSAGSYSLMQAEISKALRDRKLEALLGAPQHANHDATAQLMNGKAPTVVVTANIGCQNHLQSGTAVPVKHWIELLAERLI